MSINIEVATAREVQAEIDKLIAVYQTKRAEEKGPLTFWSYTIINYDLLQDDPRSADDIFPLRFFQTKDKALEAMKLDLDKHFKEDSELLKRDTFWWVNESSEGLERKAFWPSEDLRVCVYQMVLVDD